MFVVQKKVDYSSSRACERYDRQPPVLVRPPQLIERPWTNGEGGGQACRRARACCAAMGQGHVDTKPRKQNANQPAASALWAIWRGGCFFHSF